MNSRIASIEAQIQRYDRAGQQQMLRALRWRVQKGEAGLDPVLGAADILITLSLDAATISAALLQDAAADAGPDFGEETLRLAEGAARIAGIAADGKTIREAENIRKMLFAMVQDIRVIFIQLAGKLHRMRTLDALPPEQRRLTAQECLDIYAPLADRLGISWMKDELEDLALKHLHREVYLHIKAAVALKKRERQEFLSRMGERIKQQAAGAGIAVAVESRAKHFYSIYQKMRKRNKRLEDLYDLCGIRILCGSAEHCYTLLGMVHRLWPPLEGRFKDYIAMGKPNGYQSLHTTVTAAPDGQTDAPALTLEIQIRTWEMHRIAEYGAASHWLYKKGSSSEIIRPQDIGAINRLKDWKRGEAENAAAPGSGAFLEAIKRELLKDSVYVFTPQRKVIELPAGATPLDFAYRIHTAIGNHCAGAKAGGVIIPLDAELQNTQVVEILTAANARPHQNWLETVKTAKARSKIRSWLLQHDPPALTGKTAAPKKKQERPVPAVPAGETAPEPDPPIQRRVQAQGADTGIIQVRAAQDQGPAQKNLLIRFAQCCGPIAGDRITGYISRGRGIIIHRENCGNLPNIPDFAERRIAVQWESAAASLVKRFKAEARFAPDLFSEIEGAVRKHQGRLIEGRLDETGDRHLTGFFTVRLERQEDLRRVLQSIRGIPAVYSVVSS